MIKIQQIVLFAILLAAWALSCAATICAIKTALPEAHQTLTLSTGVLFEVSKASFIYHGIKFYSCGRRAIAFCALFLSSILLLISVFGSIAYILDTTKPVSKKVHLTNGIESTIIEQSKKINIDDIMASINRDLEAGYKTRAKSHLETLNRTLEVQNEIVKTAIIAQDIENSALDKKAQHMIYAERITGASEESIRLAFAIVCALMIEAISAIAIALLSLINRDRSFDKSKKVQHQNSENPVLEVDADLYARALDAIKSGERATYANLRRILRCNQNKMPALMMMIKQTKHAIN